MNRTGRLTLTVIVVSLAGLQSYMYNVWIYRLWPADACCQSLSVRKPPPDDISPNCSTGTIKDLEEKGFTVLRQWLPKDVQKKLQAEFAALPWHNYGRVPDVTIAHKQITLYFILRNPELCKAIHDVITRIHAETNIRVVPKIMSPERHCFGNFAYVDATLEGTDIHQDWALHSVTPGAYHHVNIYYMVDKLRDQGTGVCGVPFDLLNEHVPDIMPLLKGRSDLKLNLFFNETANQTHTEVFELYTDRQWKVAYDLSKFVCEPAIETGDAFLFRGDTFHGTANQGKWLQHWNRTVFRVTLALPTEPVIAGGGLFSAKYHMEDPNWAERGIRTKALAFRGLPYLESLHWYAWKALLSLNSQGRRILFDTRWSWTEAIRTPNFACKCE